MHWALFQLLVHHILGLRFRRMRYSENFPMTTMLLHKVTNCTGKGWYAYVNMCKLPAVYLRYSSQSSGLEYDRLCDDSAQECKDIFWESTGESWDGRRRLRRICYYHHQHFIPTTGMYGRSSVRQVAVANGSVLRQAMMEAKYFGEGLTRMGKTLYQIVWQSGKGFTYDTNDLSQVKRRTMFAFLFLLFHNLHFLDDDTLFCVEWLIPLWSWGWLGTYERWDSSDRDRQLWDSLLDRSHNIQKGQIFNHQGWGPCIALVQWGMGWDGMVYVINSHQNQGVNNQLIICPQLSLCCFIHVLAWVHQRRALGECLADGMHSAS